jgi:hypothetical protein
LAKIKLLEIMKKSIRIQDITLFIDARAANISRPIDLSQFIEVIANGKSSIKFVKETGAPFWLYNLKNAENTLKGIKKAIRDGKRQYTLPMNHVLAEEEFRIKESLSQALATAFSVQMSKEEFLNATSCLQLTEVDISFLEDNSIPKRFSGELGIKILSTALFETLGTPPYFKANRSRFWKQLLLNTKKRK